MGSTNEGNKRDDNWVEDLELKLLQVKLENKERNLGISEKKPINIAAASIKWTKNRGKGTDNYRKGGENGQEGERVEIVESRTCLESEDHRE